MKKNFYVAAFILSTLLPLSGALSPALAQIGLGGDQGKTPVAIEADNAIEWLRDSKQYIARGNAVATQGDYSVKADDLIADYREMENGSTDVWQFTAQNNVVIKTSEYEAYGDKAVYNIAEDSTILSGNNPKIKSKDNQITATDSIQFFGKQNKAVAVGKPTAIQGDKTIKADTMTGYFKKDKQGNLVLDRVIGEGNIKLVTPAEILFGDKAVYEMANGKATVTGNVRITRGENQLNGDKAVFDVQKGISTLYAGTPNDGKTAGNTGNNRVRGLFYIGGDKKTD